MIRKRWPKRLVICLCVVVALIVGGATAGKYWIIPAVIRARIASELAGRWDGRADIQRIEFDWSGSVRLAGLDLYDASGRQWAHAGAVELGISSLVSMTPALETLVTRDLTVQWHYGPGLRTPLRVSSSGGGAGEAGVGGGGGGLDLGSLGLQVLRMEGCRFVLVDANGCRQGWDFDVLGTPVPQGLALTLRQGGQTPPASASANGLSADGLIDTRAGRCSLKVAMNRRFNSDEVGAILAATGQQEALQRKMGIEGVSAWGGVDANVTIDVPLEAIGSTQVLGQADLAGWRIRHSNGVLAQDGQARVTFRQDGRLDIEVTQSRQPMKRLAPMLNLPLASLLGSLAGCFR